MVPLPFVRDHIRTVPRSPGCYLVYVDDEPFYAGMSRKDIRARLMAHATLRGSRAIRRMLVAKRSLYFEHYVIDASHDSTAEDIERAEFVFMMLFTGEFLPGNRKADGLSLCKNGK